MAATPETGEVVLKFPEWQVNSFDVDCTGQLGVLAVQKWLAVISLNHPSGKEFGSGENREKARRKLGMHNKYETKALHWNPHSTKQHLLAATNHQKIDIWDTQEGKQPLLSIKAHTRPVSDLSWSSSDPNLIASCAVDSYVHIWDTRDPKRPNVSFKTLGGLNSGASLVQWNKLNKNVLASAHDSDVRIWDLKKPATVSACISAHMNKIHDIDWNYRTEKELTTCSHDATVKFWDVQMHREPQSTIKAGTRAIWRARNYPFGRGIAMVLVPAVHSGDSRVFVYSRTNLAAPVAVLEGHSDAVTDLQWRRHRGDCHLMSLSKDRTLRIWSLSEQLQQNLDTDLRIDKTYIHIEPPSEPPSSGLTLTPLKVGIEAETSFGPISRLDKSSESQNSPMPLSNLISTTSTPISKTKSPNPTSSSVAADMTPKTPMVTNNSAPSFFSPSPSHTLEHEFSLLTDIPNMEMETLEAGQRCCTIKIQQGSHLVRMGITFPSHYPNGAAPSFILDSSTTIDITSQQELIKVVTEAAYGNVRMNRPCLEICLRKLAKTFESFLSRPEPPKVQQDIKFGKLDDDRIPFPRTSGARFCSNGLLVCFNCPMALPSESARTPKSLDMLNTSHVKFRMWPRQSSLHSISTLPKRTGSGSNLKSLAQTFNISSESSPSISIRDKTSGKERTTRRSGDSFSQYYSAVIYDVSSFLPVDYNLAKSYSVKQRFSENQPKGNKAITNILTRCSSPPQGLAGNDIKEICTKNASVALSQNRLDLVQAWNAVYLITTQSMTVLAEPDDDTPWPMHPFGRQLLQSLFSHYAKLHDVQTLAMLSCVCQLQCQRVDEYFSTLCKTTKNPSPNSSLSLTPYPERKSIRMEHYGDWDMGYQNDSSSNHDVEDTNHEEMILHQANCQLIDETMSVRCNEYRRAYGDILYRWRLLTQRSEVTKYQLFNDLNKENVLVSQCRMCHMRLEKPFCSRCRMFGLTCVVCNLAVKGCSNLCLSCGHGGHTHHLMDWFSNHNVCASGCGCPCLEASGWSQ